jgi:hypothetical protein
MIDGVWRIEALTNRLAHTLLIATVCGRMVGSGTPEAISDNEQGLSAYLDE